MRQPPHAVGYATLVSSERNSCLDCGAGGTALNFQAPPQPAQTFPHSLDADAKQSGAVTGMYRWSLLACPVIADDQVKAVTSNY
jgi:hypothetical protein